MSHTIFVHRVEITDGKGIIKDCDGFYIKQVPVIAENHQELVVEDTVRHRYVVIQKVKSDYQTCLGVPSVGLYTSDSVWGNRVSYTLYSESKKSAASIKSEIEKKIEKKYGFFLRGVDLSCIREEV